MYFSLNINNGLLCSVNWFNLLYNKNLMSPLLLVGIQWMSGPQEGGGERGVRASFLETENIFICFNLQETDCT